MEEVNKNISQPTNNPDGNERVEKTQSGGISRRTVIK